MTWQVRETSSVTKENSVKELLKMTSQSDPQAKYLQMNSEGEEEHSANKNESREESENKTSEIDSKKSANKILVR